MTSPSTNTSTAVRITGFILEDQTELTLDDLCRACAAESAHITELIEEGVLAPEGAGPQEWRFTGVHVHRAVTAVRLQRDLGVNPAGAALALQLMDELATLRAQLHHLTID
ncbi:MAG: MerR family transcriptional regulator [Polaromonas sp.]|uniref:chaperone modulator CbpM n=1 Tax=Polaromonas sp. TaxID=1869339 RepID=UPI0025CFB622|nr:chaperone modulator CbpM [Polaromonas sp.]MBI2728361.1 MerR family transcriptional regulator [Polaromonas sp.]